MPLHLLKQGNNVFLTDVDSIWVNYKNLTLLPNNFHTFHALCTWFPQKAFDRWGFVLCGGVAGFVSHPKTIEFLDHLIQFCGKTCDDQILLNDFYLEMGARWVNSSDSACGNSHFGSLSEDSELMNDGDESEAQPQQTTEYQLTLHPVRQFPEKSSTRKVKKFNFQMLTFDETSVLRSHNWTEFYLRCYDPSKKKKLWIISPNCSKHQNLEQGFKFLQRSKQEIPKQLYKSQMLYAMRKCFNEKLQHQIEHILDGYEFRIQKNSSALEFMPQVGTLMAGS